MGPGTTDDSATLRGLLLCSSPILLLVVVFMVLERTSSTEDPVPVSETISEHLFSSPAPLRLGPGNPPSSESFKPIRVIGQQQPITEIKAIPAESVEYEVDPDELILGVVINGQARAYPLNGLTGPAREIYNDTLADRSIAATW